MSFGLKDELLNLKGKLELLESELTNKMLELEVKAEDWHKKDEDILELVKKNKDKIITINIGGKIFQTKLETLMGYKDTLFYKLFSSNKLDISQEIFIDRSYDYFEYILSFFRNKKVDCSSLSSKQLDRLLIEVEFYEIQELIEFIEELRIEIKFVKFDSNGTYQSGTTMAGTNNIDHINNNEDKSLRNGICATSPGWIIFELLREVDIDQIEIGGWNGNTGIWGVSNGSGATILTSRDKNVWVTVGNIPGTFGATISTVNLTKSRAKYVKFNHNSYLGIGYFKIKKI
jgi:hypothetical protein